MPTPRQLLKGARKSKSKKSSAPALENSPQKKGMCLRVYTVSPKKPNSANRRITLVALFNGHKVYAYIPGIGYGGLNRFSTIMLRGGRTRDLPGFRYKAVRHKYDLPPVVTRQRARSKYGTKNLFK